MRVSIRARGETVAAADLDGPLLIVPTGLRAKSNGSGLTLELEKASTETPDLLVGEVPLVWWDPVARRSRVSFAEVRPPEPFGDEDIKTMWGRLVEKSLRSIKATPGQGRDTGPGAVHGRWLRPESLPMAAQACQQLLDRWPSDEKVDLIWTAPDRRGGLEDLRETDRRGGSRPGLPVRGTLVPDKVARRHRSSALWTSSRLGAACRSLVKAVEAQSSQSGQTDDLVRPIRFAGERASAGSTVPVAEPPISSWPPLAKKTLEAVVTALIALELSSGRRERVPLSKVWQLYENWLAFAVAEALEPLLGKGNEIDDSTRWGWEWTLGSKIIRVHAQATIGAKPSTILAGHADGLTSVLGDLRPDVLVTVCDPDAGQGVLCVEAKRRTSETTMDASQVGEAGAKYVWGIRSGADPDTPIASVIVASSADLAQVHDEAVSRVSSRFLLPTQGREDFDRLVRERVEDLLATAGAS